MQLVSFDMTRCLFFLTTESRQVGTTDADYLSAWHRVVLPLAVHFQPQLVLVSAGFDPALGCPEGEQRVGSHFEKGSKL